MARYNRISEKRVDVTCKDATIGLADRLKLGIGQARGVADRAGAAQRPLPTSSPTGLPAADVLPRDTELVGDSA
jgi:hypothetical protein